MTTLYVAGFMFRGPADAREVLLITKLKPEWMRGKLNAIGGKIEECETPAMAMCREFREETSVQTTRMHWREYCVLDHLSRDGRVHFFTGEWPSGGWDARSVEAEQVRWYRTAEVLWPEHELMKNLLWLIPMAMDLDQVTAHVVDRSQT